MENKIFYFTATGNSLHTARKIADEIGNTELISIPEAINNINSLGEAERIGFVFPVYAWGLPRIVEDFAEKIKLRKEQYTFAVATCAGTPGNTLIQLDKLLRKSGGTLDAGFVVKQANYTFLKANIFMKIMMRIRGDEPVRFENRLEEISRLINNREKHTLETSSKEANWLGARIHKLAVGEFKKAGSHFWVEENCSSCRICERICPRENIKINNKPIWKDNCESCFACIQWCPKEAIQYQDLSIGKKRSHHVEVSLKDMLKY